MNMLLLSLVLQTDIGTGLFVVVGGFAPSGLYANNNNFDNDNIGVGASGNPVTFPAEFCKIQWGTDFIHPPIIRPIS